VGRGQDRGREGVSVNQLKPFQTTEEAAWLDIARRHKFHYALYMQYIYNYSFDYIAMTVTTINLQPGCQNIFDSLQLADNLTMYVYILFIVK
jgi:hypothetical protein